jgi:hypothetical protein
LISFFGNGCLLPSPLVPALRSAQNFLYEKNLLSQEVKAMKNMSAITRLTRMLVGALALALAISGPLYAETAKSTAGKTAPAEVHNAGGTLSSQAGKNEAAIKEHVRTQNKLREAINKGVTEGLAKTLEAVKLIRENKIEDAVKALEAATGKFDIALGADPSMGLIPVDASIIATELDMTPEEVREQVDLAKDLLKEYKVQAARAVLMPLRDDLVTRVVSLPMTTYPDAIKLATKMLTGGNNDAALDILETALTTLVEKVSVIPLPLIRVEAMIQAASELDKEKGKEKALELLDAAEQQLKLATLLGYTDKDSEAYEDLAAQVKALKKEAKGKNFVEKMYARLNKSIKELMNRSSEPRELKQLETDSGKK